MHALWIGFEQGRRQTSVQSLNFAKSPFSSRKLAGGPHPPQTSQVSNNFTGARLPKLASAGKN